MKPRSNSKKQFIAKTLELTDGNQSEAADILNIQRTYLSKLIKELGLKE
ncbi:MAG: helix-turn-helix domain-containing protein [bacterium]